MKGSKEVIELLNEVLAGELVAINQYFLHAKMCRNWGYMALADYIRKESIDEMRHAETLVDRILFLEGLPNLQRLDKLHVGQTVPEMLQADLDVEYRALKRLNDGLVLCREKGDHASEEILRKILVAEEEHVDWIETQIALIEKLGESHYLAQQLKG